MHYFNIVSYHNYFLHAR